MTDAMKTHSVKFTDADWNTLTTIAKTSGVTIGQVISDLCKVALYQRGIEWDGGERRNPNGKRKPRE